VPSERGLRILKKCGGKVRPIQSKCPLEPGWRVVYREPHTGLLDGIVQSAEPSQSGWRVYLTNGKTIPSRHIASVTIFRNEMWAGTWLVRYHGLDGQRSKSDDEGKNGANADVPADTPSTARGPPKG